MAELIDDLECRGGDVFSDRPFQELDGALLARLAYLPFEHTVLAHRSEPIRLAEAAALLLQTPEAVAHVTQPKDLQLLDALVSSARYRGAMVLGLAAQADTETLFSALTLRLAPQLLCLVFRGTDDTLVGWKEDFNMSFRCPVPAQELAAAYLWDVAAQHTGTLLLCGHSKGGNLAVYAAANCRPDVSARLARVFSHDGPGFLEQALQSEAFRQVLPKIEKTLPQSSMIGMLLEHQENYKIVKSSSISIWQHNPFSWEINGDDFSYCSELTGDARYLNATLNQWIRAMSAEERAQLVDTIYGLIDLDNIATFAQLRAEWQTSFPEIFRFESAE